MFLVASGILGIQRDDKAQSNYGVFIGIDPKEATHLNGYDTVVIDADMFSKEEIEQLHQAGNDRVYSYLNIGSIETFRDCYLEFKDMTLGDYENWPEEQWMNVSKPQWRVYLRTKAEELVDKGVDGFFLDNADIWYYYQRPEIYQGLLEILRDLKELGYPLIINGGDAFVSKGLEEGDLIGLIDGINQETVFTSIDFENHTFGEQSTYEKAYFQEYLAYCKNKGLSIYLTEYGANEKLAKEIEAYCDRNGFSYYISSSLELDGN